MKFPNCVLVEIQLHLIEKIPRCFQIVSGAEFDFIGVVLRLLQIVPVPNFYSILLKLFHDICKLCLCQSSSSALSLLDNSMELHPVVNPQVPYFRDFPEVLGHFRLLHGMPKTPGHPISISGPSF